MVSFLQTQWSGWNNARGELRPSASPMLTPSRYSFLDKRRPEGDEGRRGQPRCSRPCGARDSLPLSRLLAPRARRSRFEARPLGCGSGGRSPGEQPSCAQGSASSRAALPRGRPAAAMPAALGEGKRQSCCCPRHQPRAGDSEKEVVSRATEKPQAEPCRSCDGSSLAACKGWV